MKSMLYQLEQHARLRGASKKLNRLCELISNLQTYLIENKASIVDYCHRYWSGEPIFEFPRRKCRQQPRQCPHEQDASNALVAGRRSPGPSGPSRGCRRPAQTSQACPCGLTPTFFRSRSNRRILTIKGSASLCVAERQHPRP